jgi:hypothetical protein
MSDRRDQEPRDRAGGGVAPDSTDRKLADVFEAEGRVRAPDRMLEDVFARTQVTRQRRPRPWDRLRLPRIAGPGAMVLVGAVVLTAAALFAAGGGGRPAPAPTLGPSAAPGATPVPQPVIGSVCVNGGGLAGDGRTLWARCPTGVRRLDVTVTPAAAGPVLDGIGLPAALGSDLWAPGLGVIARLDPVTGRTVDSLPISGVSLLAADHSALWAIAAGRLLRIDPATGRSTKGPDVIPAPLAIAVAGGAPWVTSGDGNARRFDPVTLRTVATVPVGDAPAAMATNGGALYVVSQGNAGSLTRIDLATNGATQAVLAEPTDPRSLGELAVGDAGLFVARRSGLLRVNPTSLIVESVTGLPSYPSGLVLDGTTLWVFGDGRLDRLDAPAAASVASPAPPGSAAP